MAVEQATSARRRNSEAASEASQTAADFLQTQSQLEAEAREALPYRIDFCTKELGPLRQNVFACLTCNPPPVPGSGKFTAAGICYSCSVQCHGAHELVEIFGKRRFTCDCGTTKFPDSAPCRLRVDESTGLKGDVHGEEPCPENTYNHNFRNRFCVCSCDYDPFEQHEVMYQCLGLGTESTGGCGEDWYHAGCLMGLRPGWYKTPPEKKTSTPTTSSAVGDNSSTLVSTSGTTANGVKDAPSATADEGEEDEDKEVPLPPGFPCEDDFDSFICFKCVEAYPWIKRYASSKAFLPPVYYKRDQQTTKPIAEGAPSQGCLTSKRKASTGELGGHVSGEMALASESKRARKEEPALSNDTATASVQNKDSASNTDSKPCLIKDLSAPPSNGPFSLFFTDTFREQLCHCATCLPLLTPHPHLLQEEEIYEPPQSDGDGQSTVGSASLFDLGTNVLMSMDRVKAIEGVMAYNHLKDKLKPFFKSFAESGRPVSADDIKQAFAQIRGDEDAFRNGAPLGEPDVPDGSNYRREQESK